MVSNNFLNSLQRLDHVNPANLHMNIFTKELSETSSPFTTNDPKKIGKAFSKALDALNHLEYKSRKQFLDTHYAKLDSLINLVNANLNQKVNQIKKSRFLKSMGLAEKAAHIYKKWNAPHIVRPDLNVSDSEL